MCLPTKKTRTHSWKQQYLVGLKCKIIALHSDGRPYGYFVGETIVLGSRFVMVIIGQCHTLIMWVLYSQSPQKFDRIILCWISGPTHTPIECISTCANDEHNLADGTNIQDIYEHNDINTNNVYYTTYWIELWDLISDFGCCALQLENITILDHHEKERKNCNHIRDSKPWSLRRRSHC